jgi:hypothetical protein
VVPTESSLPDELNTFYARFKADNIEPLGRLYLLRTTRCFRSPSLMWGILTNEMDHQHHHSCQEGTTESLFLRRLKKFGMPCWVLSKYCRYTIVSVMAGYHGLVRELLHPRPQGRPADGEDVPVYHWDPCSYPFRTSTRNGVWGRKSASSRTPHTPATSCSLPYCWAWGLIPTGSDTVSIYKPSDCYTHELDWPPALMLHTLAHMYSLTHPLTHPLTHSGSLVVRALDL